MNPLSQCNSAVSLTFFSTVSISALATFNEGQFFKTHVYLLTPSKLHSVPYSVQSLLSKQPFQYNILSVVLNSEKHFYIKFLCDLQSNDNKPFSHIASISCTVPGSLEIGFN